MNDDDMYMVPAEELEDLDLTAEEEAELMGYLEEEAEREAEEELQKMVEPVEEDGLQMVNEPSVGNRTVGQTHAKYQQIRKEKPAAKRKYMGKAKRR